MSSLLQADIFFFITTIAVIILLIMAVVIGYFVFKLVRHAEYIAQKIRDESDHLSDDIAYLRANIKEKVVNTSFGLGGIFRLFSGLFNRNSTKAKTTKKTKAKTGRVQKESFETDDQE
jgi:hypothetical protein